MIPLGSLTIGYLMLDDTFPSLPYRLINVRPTTNNHIATQPHSHIGTQPYSRIAILPHSYIAAEPQSHIATQPHRNPQRGGGRRPPPLCGGGQRPPSLWLCRYVALWHCDYVAMQLCGYMATWLCGYVAMWLCSKKFEILDSRISKDNICPRCCQNFLDFVEAFGIIK